MSPAKPAGGHEGACSSPRGSDQSTGAGDASWVPDSPSAESQRHGHWNDPRVNEAPLASAAGAEQPDSVVLHAATAPAPAGGRLPPEAGKCGRESSIDAACDYLLGAMGGDLSDLFSDSFTHPADAAPPPAAPPQLQPQQQLPAAQHAQPPQRTFSALSGSDVSQHFHAWGATEPAQRQQEAPLEAAQIDGMPQLGGAAALPSSAVPQALPGHSVAGSRAQRGSLIVLNLIRACVCSHARQRHAKAMQPPCMHHLATHHTSVSIIPVTTVHTTHPVCRSQRVHALTAVS